MKKETKDHVFIKGVDLFFDVVASAGKTAVKNFLNLESDERFDFEEATKTFKKEIREGVKAVADMLLPDEEEEEKNPEKIEAKPQEKNGQ